MVCGETVGAKTFAIRIANRVANKVATSSANFSAIRLAVSLAILFLQVVDVRGSVPALHRFASPAEPPAAVPDPSPPTTWVEGSGTAADLWASWCECERRDLGIKVRSLDKTSPSWMRAGMMLVEPISISIGSSGRRR